jgi:hypothetical protein
MQSVFELKEDMIGARFELQRLTILCRGHPLSRMISSFLQPNRHAAAGVVTEEDAVLALNSNLVNPWAHEPIAKLTRSDWLAEQCREAFPKSPSLLLHEALGMVLEKAEAKLSDIEIPEGRRRAYLGHCYFRNDAVELAVESYKLAIASEPVLGVVGCGLPLFSALFSLGDLAACMDFVVSQYLSNQNTQVLFPLKDLLDAASSYDGDATFNLNLALTAQIFATHAGAAFNGLRSDAFENFLDNLGLVRASEIEIDDTAIDRKRVILFLNKVCTIETLEDSTIFETYEDVENERIKILQRLIELDQGNEETYSNEIRQLTEAAEVASLLQEFEGSRIYVNERGVMRPVEGELRDAFSRYRQLLAEPSLEYQAEDIRRRIKELIDRSDPTADLSNFHLPATEREGLLRRMYASVLNSFVLDPHYGLKTYLSTNILHGALEGELRHSLGKRGLLMSSEQSQMRRNVESVWSAQLDALSDSEWDVLTNALARFSKRVGELVADLKSKKIRVRIVGESGPEGLIDFTANGDQTFQLMEKISVEMEFGEFEALLFENIWEHVDRSLTRIQDTVSGPFSKTVNTALDSLQATIERNIEKSKAVDLLNAIALGRTEFDLDVKRVVGWFARKPNRWQTPFFFETALSVAIKATNNCFPRSPLTPEIHVDVPIRLKGAVLDPLVHVLSNCLQNAVQRSGFSDKAPALSVKAEVADDRLCVEIRNELDPGIDIQDRRVKVEDLMRSANTGDNPSIVSGEGGSGFRKIRRSLSLDIGVEPTLSATISDEREFSLEFSLPFASIAEM